jgi:molecular chaperone DnaJ
MSSKDYYFILGVKKDASQEGVRRAYRRLAKAHHPDVTGQRDSSRFQEINEAYEVLSDPEARERYNRRREGRPEGPGDFRRPFSRTEYGGVDPFEAFFGFFFNSRPERQFRRRRRPAPRLEVILTPAEARFGVRVPVDLPVTAPCRACAGRGFSGPFTCRACRGEGLEEARETIILDIPPGVEDGAVYEWPIGGLTAEPDRIIVEVVVDEPGFDGPPYYY